MATCAENLTKLTDDYQNALDFIGDAWVQKDFCDQMLLIDEDHLAIGFLAGAVTYILQGMTWLANGTTWWTNPPFLPTVIETCSGGEITWQAIVEAWVKDDFEGRFWTIGVIDRMRQILWNEPFDLTWAAKPEQAEIPE